MSTVPEWWSEYRRVLSDPMNRIGKSDRLNQLTTDLMAQGIIRLGVPMTRNGAESIARQCDELLAKGKRR